MFQREEVESILQLFRQDVDNVFLVCFDFEWKVEFLQEEIVFLKKLYDEEIQELQVQIQEQYVQIDVDVFKFDFIVVLCDVCQQYESVVVKNFQEVEEWYKFKFVDFFEVVNWNNDVLCQVKQELNEYWRQVQLFICEVDVFKGINEFLECQMCEMEENFVFEVVNYQDIIGCLQDEI